MCNFLSGWKKFYTEVEEIFLEYKLRIIEIMEQLDIGSEVILFSDVYEDKSDVSKVLVRGMFNYFRSKFDAHCETFVSSEDRLLYASAWYAICFEKCSTYNGKILLGLPWIIADEMCQLAQLCNRRSKSWGDNGQVAVSGDAVSSIDHVPDRSTLDSEDSEDMDHLDTINTVLLESQPKQMAHNTSVMHYYWNPTIIVTQLKMMNIDDDQLMDIHNQLMIEMQLKVTLGLIMKWIDRIKRDIYMDRDDEEGKMELIQLNNYGTALGESTIKSFTEEELLRAFIMVRVVHKMCLN